MFADRGNDEGVEGEEWTNQPLQGPTVMRALSAQFHTHDSTHGQ